MNVDFATQRVKMVEGQLRTVDVTDVDILEAFASVPREAFVPSRRRELAYIDEDVDISVVDGQKRYLMEPSSLARLLQLAEIGRDDVILDVGAGTGYSSAILSRVAGSVIALECDDALAAAAAETLSELGCDNVAVVQGELTAGYAGEAPYDVIVLEGAVDEIPTAFFDQLKEGGRLVAVEGVGNAGVARLYVKKDGLVSNRRGFNAAVRPLPGFQRQPAFEF